MKHILVALLFAALCCPAQGPAAFSPARAEAAGLTEDHTLLYYMIEMQRRYKKTCNGSPMPEAPSLTPSSQLRDLAFASLRSGAPAESLAASRLGGTVFWTATVLGESPQQAFDSLLGAHCPSFMRQELRYIGAARDKGRWTVILAASEPGAAPPPDGAQGPEPALTPDPGPDAPAHAPAVQEQGGHAAQNATAPAYAPLPPGGAGPDSDPAAPAKPLVLHELEVGPTGDVRFPQGAPGQGPDTPPQSAGPPDDPAAPAKPVATGEYEVNRAGEIAGPYTGPPADFPRRSPPPTPYANQGMGLLPLIPDNAPGGSGESGASFAAGLPAPGAPAPAQPRPGVTPLVDERGTLPAESLTVSPAPTLGQSLPVTPAPAPPASPAGDAPRGDELFALVNAARAAGGFCAGTRLSAAPALAENPLLSGAARKHAADMAARRYFSSTSPDGVTLGKRVGEAGYFWGLVAENIASTKGDASQVMRQWMAKEDQCRNLMGAEYREAGAAHDPVSGIWVFTLAAPMEESIPRTP